MHKQTSHLQLPESEDAVYFALSKHPERSISETEIKDDFGKKRFGYIKLQKAIDSLISRKLIGHKDGRYFILKAA